jgi:hypothetical protein
MAANLTIIEALRDFNGDRFPINKGELRVIRFGYEKPDFIPNVVALARAGKSINWGGAVVFSEAYKIIFDGAGPIPVEISSRLPRAIHH